MDCPHHLPHLCDCGSLANEPEKNPESEELTMPEAPKPPTAPALPATEYKPPSSEAEEHERFGKFLNTFLEEDDAPNPTGGAPANPGSGGVVPSVGSGTLDIAAEINRALDARESKAKQSDEIGKFRLELDELKKPRKAKWYHPFTPFADR